MNVKSDKERKGSVLRFRVTQDERKRIKQLSDARGLSVSGIFRAMVLGEATGAVLAEQQAIIERTDITDLEKKKLLEQAAVKRVAAVRVKHEKAMKVREKKTAAKYKGKRSA